MIVRSTALLACIAAALTACGSSHADGAGTMHVDSLVLHDGDHARAVGRVVAPHGRAVQFCPGDMMEAAAGSAGPDLTDCRGFGVVLIGADLHRLAHRRASGAGVVGTADITGVYRHGTLRVSRQQPATPTEPLYTLTSFIPCSPPTGGWPHGPQAPTDRAQDYAQVHPDRVVDIAYLSAGRQRWLVYVLTDGDPAPVDAALRPTYGKRLCVTRSQYTNAQIDAGKWLNDQLFRRPGTRIYGGGGGSLNARSQPQITAQIGVLNSSTAAAIDTQPAGLWNVAVWLKPAS